jgi:hypothetical protein
LILVKVWSNLAAAAAAAVVVVWLLVQGSPGWLVRLSLESLLWLFQQLAAQQQQQQQQQQVM